ncbi:MAG: metalloregulator ArsR/SmtB family transcription factor [Clostridiales bacterium]|jgi:DNA-binding transcriptional ArsR family regulator|nr:metalloregulator ArsR/SmtB family transcription factor [Clostridiales bacterium]
MEDKAKIVAELLKILANENRLLILCALIEGEKTVNEIAGFVPKITQPALSQHLSLLKTAGILRSDKQGVYVAYSIADLRVTEVIATLKKYYCEEGD